LIFRRCVAYMVLTHFV